MNLLIDKRIIVDASVFVDMTTGQQIDNKDPYTVRNFLWKKCFKFIVSLELENEYAYGITDEGLNGNMVVERYKTKLEEKKKWVRGSVNKKYEKELRNINKGDWHLFGLAINENVGIILHRDHKLDNSKKIETKIQKIIKKRFNLKTKRIEGFMTDVSDLKDELKDNFDDS